VAPTLQLDSRMVRLLLGLVLASGCVVGDPGPGTSGGGGGGGGGGGTGSGAADQLIDGGAGSAAATCTGAAYDPCTDSAQCTAGTCQLFNGSGFQVCTQTCTPGDSTTCPMQNGQPAQCNNMGLCKPLAANDCTR
jgi:hypothetical protein